MPTDPEPIVNETESGYARRRELVAEARASELRAFAEWVRDVDPTTTTWNRAKQWADGAIGSTRPMPENDRLAAFDATMRLRKAARAIIAAADDPDTYVNMPGGLLDELRAALGGSDRCGVLLGKGPAACDRPRGHEGYHEWAAR